MSPFPTFDYKWDPDTVVTLGNATGIKIQVLILEILCYARTKQLESANDKATAANKSDC